MDERARRDLAEAVEELYLAFAGRPLRPWTEPCLDCCSTVEEEAALHALPLRDLSAREIGAYAGHAMGTWGGVDEFTHFLPRILEVLSYEDFDDQPVEWFGIAAFMKGFRDAEWLRWPDREVRAVRTWFAAKWHASMVDPQPVHELNQLLEGFAWAGEDLTPFLRAYDELPADQVHVHLGEDLMWWIALEVEQPSTYGGWVDARPQLEQVVRWLRRPEMLARARAQARAGFLDDRFIDLIQAASLPLPPAPPRPAPRPMPSLEQIEAALARREARE